MEFDSNDKKHLEDGDRQPHRKWTIHDAFEYAPPKPDGDPWSLLLEPLMKEDKIRCDSWKAEVENLLIFAGLFSAVVTAFLIESYKRLKQDPNDVMISLLSHIAMRLDNSSMASSTSSVSPGLIPSFSPTSSAIQINVFLFVSLILSLTTVLVGIICLQWLREHQSYPGLSPRKNYAIFNMRAEGLERWHVPAILSALPLILQLALILFFAGLFNFLLGIGGLAIIIPGCLSMGVAILFLVITTISPALQGICLFAYSSDGPPPVQCPYKSPQSRVFYSALRPIFNLVHWCHPRMRSFSHRMQRLIIRNMGESIFLPPKEDQFTRYIYLSWLQIRRSWSYFDEGWLSLRDVYMRRAHDRQLRRMDFIGDGKDRILPIYDIVEGLQSQSWKESFGPAAYHAFAEIADLTLLPVPFSKLLLCQRLMCTHFDQNAYLHDLLVAHHGKTDVCLSDNFVFDKFLHDDNLQTEAGNVQIILKHQSMFNFVSLYISINPNPLFHIHKGEIALRLIRHFCEEKYDVRSAVSQRLKIPLCLDLADFDAWTLMPKASTAIYNVLSWQIADVALLFFKEINKDVECTGNTLGQTVGLGYIPPSLYGSIKELAEFTKYLLFDSKGDDAVKEAFSSLFIFIRETLEDEITLRLKDPNFTRPSLLFYATALFVSSCVKWRVKKTVNEAFDSLFSTFWKYKELSIDQGKIDPSVVERRFFTTEQNRMDFDLFPEALFMEDWWQDFTGWTWQADLFGEIIPGQPHIDMSRIPPSNSESTPRNNGLYTSRMALSSATPIPPQKNEQGPHTKAQRSTASSFSSAGHKELDHSLNEDDIV